MIEGFWILKIQPPPVTSGGVIMFTQGKIFGGDNGFTWVGTYSVSGQMLKARVRVHNFEHFSGVLDGDVITGTAMIANQPQHSLGLRMEKRAQI
jgi:hypothetical protein